MKSLYRIKIPIAGLIIVALVVPLVIFLAVASDSERPGIPIGEFAPNIEGETLSGEVVTLTDLQAQNQWIVVNFFASWCPPCVVEHQEFTTLSAESIYPLQIVSVLFQETEAKGREFFMLHGGNWPAFVKDTTSIALSYRILSVPETYLLAPNGRVAGHWRGQVTAQNITDRIETIINSASTTTIIPGA